MRKTVLLVMIVLFLATVAWFLATVACGTAAVVPITAMPTLVVVQPTLTPYPTQIPPTPYPTQAPVPTLAPTPVPVVVSPVADTASVLLANGFTLTDQTCDTPCQTYVNNSTKVVAVAYNNGSFGIGVVISPGGDSSNDAAAAQSLATITTSLYGPEVTSWIGTSLTDIASTGDPAGVRTGTIGNYHLLLVTKLYNGGVEALIMIVPIASGTSS